MLVDGYFRVGRLAGVDLRLHWSVPVGALIFGSLRLEPILWLAFFAVLMVHEIGHAVLVRAAGFRLLGIDVTGYGGQCRFRGSADALEHAIIAWGGMLAQGLLLIAALLGGAIFGPVQSHAGSLIQHAFIEINIWIMVINLLPFAPLDGARAWGLFAALRSRGWTLGRLVFHPLWRWAQRRRQRRTTGAGPLDVSSDVAQGTPRRHTSQVEAGSDPADADGAVEDDILEKPSAQAQRELAALLQRIGDEAGKAKKRP